MCDYSLHHVASRPAKISDRLVTTELGRSSARGFAAVGEHGAKLVIHDDLPQVAVCLRPGTELAFDDDVEYDRAFRLWGKARVNHKVALFRQIDLDDPYVQHDALEFPNGQVLKVSQLVAGQTATVLQLPVAAEHPEHVETGRPARPSGSRVALNRASFMPGMASVLMPNQGAVMLWQASRTAALGFSTALVESFRRLTAHKQRLGTHAETIEPGFDNDVLAVTLSKKPPAQKPEKKIELHAVA
jgi:hypothetical protein